MLENFQQNQITFYSENMNYFFVMTLNGKKWLVCAFSKDQCMQLKHKLIEAMN